MENFIIGSIFLVLRNIQINNIEQCKIKYKQGEINET